MQQETQSPRACAIDSSATMYLRSRRPKSVPNNLPVQPLGQIQRKEFGKVEKDTGRELAIGSRSIGPSRCGCRQEGRRAPSQQVVSELVRDSRSHLCRTCRSVASSTTSSGSHRFVPPSETRPFRGKHAAQQALNDDRRKKVHKGRRKSTGSCPSTPTTTHKLKVRAGHK